MLQFRSLGGLQHRSLRDSVSPVLSVVRNYWREVVQEYRQADGSVTYEDPEKTHSRLRRASNAEGINRRRFKYRFYEKPWMKRKRLKNEVIYKANKQKVDDLTRWIVFRQQNNLKIDGRKSLNFRNDDDDIEDR